MPFVLTNLALAAVESIFYWTHMSYPVLLAWLALVIMTCLGLIWTRSPGMRKNRSPWRSSPTVANTLILLLAATWGGQAFFMPLTDPGILLVHTPALILLGFVFTHELSSQPFSSIPALFLLLAPTLYLFYSEAGILLQPALVISLLAIFLLTLIFLKPLSARPSSASQPDQEDHTVPVPLRKSPASSSNPCLCPDDVIWESILKITNPGALHSDWQNCFEEIHPGICK
ncbi:MAG: hypothetical protein KKH60_09085, partial [Proteobacteria bacterium]|nr:hypothetical protein [Pseudomonadota bacterium]